MSSSASPAIEGRDVRVKASAFACDSCRRKKRKCDAKQPECSTCSRHHVECHYPQRRGTLAVEKRFEQLESQLCALTRQVESIAENVAPRRPYWTRRPSDAASPRTRLNASGRYHSSSSFYHLPHDDSQDFSALRSPRHTPVAPHDRPGLPPDVSDSTRQMLAVNASSQRDMEPVVLFLYTLGVPDAPHDLYKYLLDSHWTWIHPFWNFIYRPAFTRGMLEGNGEYFNSFLLHAVLAHATRFRQDQPPMAGYENMVDYFWHKAKASLMDQMDAPPTVATVQGLLLLSAVENSLGRISQSWTFSGMAFRMLQDLGIHLDGYDERSKFSQEDLEVRRRLWWSSYLWDKMISLYFGRTPMLDNSPLAPPQVLIDDSAEYDLWYPLGCDVDFHPVPGHAVSNFGATCRVATVLDAVLRRFYCDPASAVDDAKLMEDATALLDLPEHLRLHPDRSAPHHIASLNALIHTTVILAHRPHARFSSSGNPADLDPSSVCLDSAHSILDIAGRIFSAFAGCRFVLVAYCIWTAATVFVLKIRSTRHVLTAQTEVSAFLKAKGMLDTIAKVNAGLKQACAILEEQMHKLGLDAQHSAVAPAIGASTLDRTAFHDIFGPSFLTQGM